MLKLSCNVTNHLHTFSFFSDSSLFIPVNRRTLAVSSSQPRKPALDPLRAVMSADQGSISPVNSCTPADRFRAGRLMEDGYSYKEKFIVRSYEVGINKTATVETIANLLQVRITCCFFLSLGSEWWLPFEQAFNCGAVLTIIKIYRYIVYVEIFVSVNCRVGWDETMVTIRTRSLSIYLLNFNLKSR